MDIPQIIYYSLLGLFILIILGSLLAGLIGFLKGLYKTALKTIIKAVLIAIFLFTTPAITNAVGNISLANFHLSFTISSTTIQVTTIQQTIADIITSTGMIAPIGGLSLYETAISLANAILAYFVFFNILIVIQLTISLITCIMYNGIFRWFLPVETKADIKKRKKDKKKYEVTNGVAVQSDSDNKTSSTTAKKKWKLFRLPSMFLGFAQEFVFLCILIAPLTSLSRVVVSNKTSVVNILDKADMDGKKYIPYFDSIEKSPLYTMLGLGNFDSTVTNVATSVDINGQKVNLNSLVTSFFDVAKPILDGDSISYDKALGAVTINYATLLSNATVSSIIQGIIENKVLVALIPPLVDIGINMMSNSEFVMPKFSFENIDWTNELSILNEVYGNLYNDTTVIKSFIAEDGKSLTFKNFKIECSKMSDEQIKKYADISSKVLSLQMINNNINKLMAGFGSLSASNGLEILPTDEKSYENVDWKQDVNIFITNLFKVMRALDFDISADMNVNVLKDNILSALKSPERREVLRTMICGNQSGNEKGLLDTTIFQVINIPRVISSSLSTVPALSTYVESLDFDELFKGLDKNAIKNEFSSMFDIISKIFDSDAIDLSNLQNIDFTKQEVIDVIVDMLKISERSKIFTNMFPMVLKAMLHNNNIKIADYLYGVTPYDIDYYSEDFMVTIESIITDIPTLIEMGDKISAESDPAKMIQQIDTALLKRILTTIAKSQAFNRDGSTGVYADKKKNVIVHKFLTNLFSSDAFKNIDYQFVSLDEVQEIDWDEEIQHICDIIDNMKKNLSFLNNDYDINKIEDPDSIGMLLRDGMSSKYLSKTILHYINTSIEKLFKKINLPISIEKLRTSLWLKKDREGRDDIDRMVEMIKLFKKVSAENTDKDFSDIDLKTIDINDLNALFTVIYRTNFIKEGIENEVDPFGKFIYCAVHNKSVEKVDNFLSAKTLNSVENEYQWIITSSRETVVSDKPYPYEVTTKGAVKDLCDFIRLVQIVGPENITGGKLPVSSDYKNQIESMKDGTFYKAKINRLIFIDLFNEAFSKFNDSSSFVDITKYISIELINKTHVTGSGEEYLVDLQQEMELFEHLYKLVDSGDFSSQFLDISSIAADKDKFNDVKLLLSQMGKSVLFTTKDKDANFSPVTYFIFNIIKENDLLYKSSLSKNEKNAEMKMIEILNSIEDIDDELSNKFVNIIQATSGVNINADLSFFKDANREQFKNILLSLNESSIFHLVPISILKDDLFNKNFDSLFADPEDSSKIHTINFYTHMDGNKEEDILYWANDISLISDMVFSDETFKQFISGQGSRIDQLSIKDTDISLSIIYYISEMNIFKKNRSYFLYNLISNSFNDKTMTAKLFKESTVAPYGENKKVYRLEELFFADSYLNEGTAEERKVKKLADLQMLDSIIKKVLSDFETIEVSTSVGGLAFSNSSYEELLSNSYTSSVDKEGKYVISYRSKLTSEVLASMLDSLFNASGSQNPRPLNGLNVDFYSNSYELVNAVEGRAIDSLISIASNVGDSYATSIEAEKLKEHFKGLGFNFNDEVVPDPVTDKYMKFSSCIDNIASYNKIAERKKYNSVISTSESVYDYLKNISVQVGGQSIQISSLGDNYIKGEIESGKTYYEIASSIIS